MTTFSFSMSLLQNKECLVRFQMSDDAESRSCVQGSATQTPAATQTSGVTLTQNATLSSSIRSISSSSSSSLSSSSLAPSLLVYSPIFFLHFQHPDHYDCHRYQHICRNKNVSSPEGKHIKFSNKEYSRSKNTHPRKTENPKSRKSALEDVEEDYSQNDNLETPWQVLIKKKTKDLDSHHLEQKFKDDINEAKNEAHNQSNNKPNEEDETAPAPDQPGKVIYCGRVKKHPLQSTYLALSTEDETLDDGCWENEGSQESLIHGGGNNKETFYEMCQTNQETICFTCLMFICIILYILIYVERIHILELD